MSDLTVDTRELTKLMNKIANAGKRSPVLIRKMFKKIEAILLGESRKRAPRSATKSEYVRTLKSGRTKRKTSSFTSGNLKKSIRSELKKFSLSIHVPANSPAGKYAEKIHDERGKTWRNIGKHNDAKATDKFIFKAYDEEEKVIDAELNEMLDAVIKGIFT